MVHPLLKFSFNYFIISLCFILSINSQAAVVEGLFNGVVEVSSQQQADRGEAFNQALLKVLTKLSGQRDRVLQEDVQQSFFPAERFVQSFSYKENPAYQRYLTLEQQIILDGRVNSESEPMSLAVNGSQKETENIKTDELTASLPEIKPLPFILAVDFAPHSLEKQMRRSNLPVWGSVRPDIMFWVLIESEGARDLLGESKPSKMLDSLFDASKEYALPISFPIGDETDLNAVNSSDLWGLFPDAIDQASTRYSANGNIMIRVFQSMDNVWNANWHLSVNNSIYTGMHTSTSVEQISADIIQDVTSVLSERFAVIYTDDIDHNQITLEISNINSFKDYIDVQTFIQSLSPVKELTLEWNKGSVMSVSIQLNSSIDQFKEYLNLSGKLKFVSTNSYESLFEPANEKSLEEVSGMALEPTASPVSPVLFKSIDKYKWMGVPLNIVK